jgi:cytoskeletal protein CcmA (bactofilin family)
MKHLKNQSGQALVLVMMVLTVMLLMGSSLLTQGGKSRAASYGEGEMVRAGYIAEAGAERALAEIKNGPARFKGLTLDENVELISNLVYGSGKINSVMVKRISGTGNPTAFYIKAEGTCGDAQRTIRVQGEMYDPVDFSRGVWVGTPSSFSNNSIIISDVTAQGALTFINNSAANGVITAAGDVTLNNNMTATRIITGGNLTVKNNVVVTMDVSAAGNVKLEENAQIAGEVNAGGDIEMSNNSVITGNVYYNGSIINSGATIEKEQHPGAAETVDVFIPAFPVLDEDWYAENADQILAGDLSGTFSLDGIWYHTGDISISGAYSGNGTVVAGGKVTIDGDLDRADAESSLAVLSFGNNGGVGIEVGKDTSAHALLYTGNQIVIDNNAHVYGSLVCNELDLNKNTRVTYDGTLQDGHPDWVTTVVKVTSWKEKYSVF